MEKLLKLLTKYEKEVEKHDGFPIYNWKLDRWDIYAVDDFYWTIFKGWEAQEIICSKGYGFIHWLITKAKVDTTNEDLLSLCSELWDYDYEKCLLMLLSIQLWPLDFLTPILK